MRETASLDRDPDPNSADSLQIAGLGRPWQAAILRTAGLTSVGKTLELDPKLPHKWSRLSVKVQWRGRSARGLVEEEVADLAP